MDAENLAYEHIEPAGIAVAVLLFPGSEVLTAVTDRDVEQAIIVKLEIAAVVVSAWRRNVVDQDVLAPELPVRTHREARNPV